MTFVYGPSGVWYFGLTPVQICAILEPIRLWNADSFSCSLTDPRYLSLFSLECVVPLSPSSPDIFYFSDHPTLGLYVFTQASPQREISPNTPVSESRQLNRWYGKSQNMQACESVVELTIEFDNLVYCPSNMTHQRFGL